MWPGETFMQVTLSDSEGSIGQNKIFKPYSDKNFWYPQLTPGARYVLSVWARSGSDFSGSAELTFETTKITRGTYLGTPLSHQITLTNEWQRHDFSSMPQKSALLEEAIPADPYYFSKAAER